MPVMDERWTCPVCGYPALHEPPRSPEGHPSYEICPSCIFEYGEPSQYALDFARA
jgi:rubredoxin